MSTLTLIFLSGGQAILEEDGEQTWASDDDEDFDIEIGNDKLDIEDESTVREYLIEHDIISEREAQVMSVEVEGEDNDREEDVIDADFVDVTASRSN